MNFNKKYLYISLLLPIQIILVKFLSKNSLLIEKYYSNIIYPYISISFKYLLGWIPFSFGDFLVILFIFFFIKELFELIRNKFKNGFNFFLKFTSFLSIIYFCFYLFWGLNYFRKPLYNNLNLKKSKYNTNELIETTKNIIKKLNFYHLKITKNDTLKIINYDSNNKIYDKAIKAYTNIAKLYPQFKYNTPSIKNSLISLIQSYNGTSGYINPLTNEAQINKMIPKTSMPTTVCHEIAHQIGWAAESEANFIGFLASANSIDSYFKYAAYRMAFVYLIKELKKRDYNCYKILWKTINKGIIKDFNSSYNHWKKYKNPIEPYIKKGYNSYLKANNQKKGIKSYNYVVDLLISYNKSLKIKI